MLNNLVCISQTSVPRSQSEGGPSICTCVQQKSRGQCTIRRQKKAGTAKEGKYLLAFRFLPIQPHLVHRRVFQSQTWPNESVMQQKCWKIITLVSCMLLLNIQTIYCGWALSTPLSTETYMWITWVLKPKIRNCFGNCKQR